MDLFSDNKWFIVICALFFFSSILAPIITIITSPITLICVAIIGIMIWTGKLNTTMFYKKSEQSAPTTA